MGVKRSVCLVLLLAACGDDGETNATGVTSATSLGTSTSEATDTEATETTAAETSSSSSSESSSGGSESSSSSEGGSSTTGLVGDPTYPPVDGGACPDDTVPTTLPGGSICSPFCADEGAACPVAATGDAVPTCTPFERKGGSGDPCKTSETCPEDEACGLDDTCVAVAFWACQLVCEGGEACPDDMTCTAIGACGYD